jgi:hypothetical protein
MMGGETIGGEPGEANLDGWMHINKMVGVVKKERKIEAGPPKWRHHRSQAPFRSALFSFLPCPFLPLRHSTLHLVLVSTQIVNKKNLGQLFISTSTPASEVERGCPLRFHCQLSHPPFIPCTLSILCIATLLSKASSSFHCHRFFRWKISCLGMTVLVSVSSCLLQLHLPIRHNLIMSLGWIA